MTSLTDLGFSHFFASHFDRLGRADLVPARIAADGPGIYQLLGCCASVGELSGRLRHELRGAERPTAGDWVAISERGDRAVIHHLLPRRTALTRRAADTESAGLATSQVIAANVDHVGVITSANRDFNPRRIERYLTAIWESGAIPLVVLNKVDLVEDSAPLRGDIAEVALGVPVVAVSALTGHGLAALREMIAPGTTVGFVGSSGVGKSSLINRLLGREAQHVAAIREDDQRGRHTTTRRELVPLPDGGVLIDTPGMRELGLIEDEGGIDAAFVDITVLAAECRFSDCRHETEPGCAVQEAVLTGRLGAERLHSYHKLQREIAALERRRNPILAANERKKWKTIHKGLRAREKVEHKWM